MHFCIFSGLVNFSISLPLLVYETCNLGVHAPQSPGNEMEIDSGKLSPGFVLLDCPQSMKIDTKNASMLGSISDYFLCLSNGWDVTSFLKTLSKVLKSLKFGSSPTVNAKEGNSGSCIVSCYLDIKCIFFFY